MKVSVSIPEVSESIMADLSEESYKTILDEGRKDAILALLRSFAEVYGNEYITNELGEEEPDLTSEELDDIVRVLRNRYDSINDLAKGLNNYSLHDLIRECVGLSVEARMKVYKLKITCTIDKTIYIRARSSQDIECAIDKCYDLTELMEYGDLDLYDVSIEDAPDHEADMDVDEI